jgi:AraC family transcriptional regulator
VTAAVAALIGAQRAWMPGIERCTGRSLERKLEQYLRLLRARAVLDHASSPDLDMQRVAEIARLSANYFVSVFGSVFGMPPHQYRIERRLQLARELIAHTRTPINQILRQLGLDSHSTFTRVFRHRFGMSASRLRANAPARGAS